MQIAIVLYDRLTALDAVGPYEILARLTGAEVVTVAETRGPVRNDVGSLSMTADAALDEVPRPGIVVVPGGPGQVAQMADGPLHEWLRDAGEHALWLTSVCTGSLILGAAGLLRGRRATSHWLALDQLRAYGAEPARERVVFDGGVVTAAGVSAGIDMGLALVGRLQGDTMAQAVQLAAEYDPRPPYDAGAPEKAPAEVVRLLRSRSRFVLEGVRD
ncbi:DJ-1/PfpI family protein [Streptomyces sp. MAR4 CNX-425]|uniref:DJ-1/PfpI family protein n=1 Tax=Streptomyces sp. MAR4 CNX-425 TaxID=3406343 RepID=UPI003B50ED48